jgi:hypothetical protein
MRREAKERIMTKTQTTAARPLRHCAECGAEFAANRPQQQFCQPAHKTAFQNRAAVEGRAIVALAKAWRAARNRKEDRQIGADCLAELSAILDSFNADDRKAGRPGPMPYAAQLLKQGRFIDRRR